MYEVKWAILRLAWTVLSMAASRRADGPRGSYSVLAENERIARSNSADCVGMMVYLAMMAVRLIDLGVGGPTRLKREGPAPSLTLPRWRGREGWG